VTGKIQDENNIMIRLDSSTCTDIQAATRREWLETNGIGGFASSTIPGMNTRRYHSLLCAATRPPVGRVAMLSKLEETLILDGRRYDLSSNQYPGVIHPNGHRYLSEFRLDPFPVMIYDVDGVQIQKSVFMIYGENGTVVRYSLVNSEETVSSILLEVRPLVAFRDYHSTSRENDSLNHELHVEPGLVSLEPYAGLPRLYLAHNARELNEAGYWYRNFELEAERQRGLDYKEDLYSPFALTFDLTATRHADIIASMGPHRAAEAELYEKREIARRRAVVEAAPGDDPLVRQLVAAADQYIVSRAEGKTVIAGYHWFTDWGRDTMISLPGLTLVTGQIEVTKSILLEFVDHLDKGMLPNRCPDAGEAPEYNTVDATLWLFEAVRQLIEYTGDYAFVRSRMYSRLMDTIDWHERGTRYSIRMDADGLLGSGEPGVQLTWMDAKVGDYVVTPRHGKAVEIQALWYNALRVMQALAERFGDKPNEARFAEIASRAKKSFNRIFWNEDASCLYDVVNGEARDATIRPNQILAVSLRYSMLTREKAKRVVDVVERELLTPYGLRSLAVGDPAYRPRYEGDVWGRDTAYHQGTVWAWLMGPYITAYLKVNPGRRARATASGLLAEFGEHLKDAGLGHVSEIFDADAPHEPRGCIAQAWSVAEVLRAAVEEVYGIKPTKGRSRTRRAAQAGR
jgi:predicted glycogen debranching enzyme